MSTFLKRFQEAARVLVGQAVTVELVKAQWGRKPDVSFKAMMDAYRKDAVFRDSIDLMTGTAIRRFYTTCATEDDYDMAPKAKALIDNWNKRNRLDQKLQVMGKELIITGSSVAELITPEKPLKLRHIPIYTFERIFSNEAGEFEETEWTRKNNVKMGLLQSTKYGGKLLKPESIIHFCWNPVDDSGWGCGIMRTILETYSWQEENANTKQTETFTRRSLMDMKAAFDEQLTKIVEKYAGPVELYVAEKKQTAEQLVSQFQTAPKQGARIIASGGPVDVKTPPFEPRARFMEYLNYLFNQVCLAGQTPMPRLFTMAGWSEASARVGQEIFDAIINPIQDLVKRAIEDVWDIVIDKAGMDPEKAQVRLNWGAQKEPEINMVDMLRAAELQLIRPEEFRKNAVKFGWQLWEKQTEETQTTESAEA